MKKFGKKLGIVLVVLVLGAVVTGLVAARWIVPGIVAAKVHAAFAAQWDGEVQIESTDVNYSGPIVVRNVDFRDRAGRSWMHVGRAELTLRNWPGLSPVLSAIDARDVAVSAHFLNGRLDLPVRKQEKPPSSTDTDFQKITIRDIAYTMFDAQSNKARWAFEQFEAIKGPGGLFRVSLTSPPEAAGTRGVAEQTFGISGSVDQKTYDADLTLDGNLPADSARMAVVLRAMAVPVIKDMKGQLHCDHVRVRGRLNDLALWQLGGQINLKGFQFEGPHGNLAQGLDCTMALGGRTITITQFKANGCNGTVTASGQASVDANWTVTYKGMLDATNVDLPMLTETVAGPGSKSHRGILSLHVKYSGVGTDIHGSGLLSLDNADVMPQPVFAEVFKQMNLGTSDQLRQSSVRAVLAFDGPRFTVEHGRLANALSAIDVERHGTINAQTHQIDLYILAVPLKAVDDFFKLPVIGLVSKPFRKIGDKLMRLHIQGDWSDPPSTLVKKAPLGDVPQATEAFFKDVTKSGGKLGEGTLKAVDDIFRVMDGGQ